MAKCVKKNNKFQRVKDNVAQKLVQEGWEYCPKHEWRNQKGNQKGEDIEK